VYTVPIKTSGGMVSDKRWRTIVLIQVPQLICQRAT